MKAACAVGITQMFNPLKLHYDVTGSDFAQAGEASSSVKNTLKQLGFPPGVVRRIAIALYEGEINMVIHAGGGEIDAVIHPDRIEVTLSDSGPGIYDIDLAMQAGYSTATESIRDLGFGAGMGLPNMREYSDEFEVKSTPGVGTTVKMVVYNK
jgi:anti-sigma regulatory factor (Ser/Thr protein kinase)